MTVSIEDSAQLTPVESGLITLVAAGSSNLEAAHRLPVRPETVPQHLKNIGRKLGTGSRAAHVRAALMTGQIAPLELPGDAPDFTGAELRLVGALAWYSVPGDIAAAAGLPEPSVDGAAAALVEKAGAQDRAHLVALAYPWGLLPESAPDLRSPLT